MNKILEYPLRLLARISGYKLAPQTPKVGKDMDKEFRAIYETCRPFSMTSLERMYALYQAVVYVIRAGIPGDFVECGVWRGGSAMVIAETLKGLGETNRKIFLYDTFEGMPEPEKRDVKIRTGKAGISLWKEEQKKGGWCNVDMEEVKQNVSRTEYPNENFVFVKGKVEDVIPNIMPSGIALLRLDTDWYASTMHEFEHLYPLLSKSGVLIIDDYGSWSGAKEATDEYFSKHGITLYLHRVDSGRIAVKN